jgi:hypothetical protein
MYYPNVPSIVETDDFDELRSMSIQTHEDCQEITLTFTLNPRKHYNPGERPERLFLTEGANPRFLYPTPRPQRPIPWTPAIMPENATMNKEIFPDINVVTQPTVKWEVPLDQLTGKNDAVTSTIISDVGTVTFQPYNISTASTVLNPLPGLTTVNDVPGITLVGGDGTEHFAPYVPDTTEPMPAKPTVIAYDMLDGHRVTDSEFNPPETYCFKTVHPGEDIPERIEVPFENQLHILAPLSAAKQAQAENTTETSE